MADVRAVVLNEGKTLVSGALAGFFAYGPTRFRVGTAAGFEPSSGDTDVRGRVVFTGLSGLIQRRKIAEDTVRYTLTITEKYGPFDIGNIVLFASAGDGPEKALISVVLPFTVKKEPSDPNLTASNPYPIPGSRFIVNITVKHTLDGGEAIVEIKNPNFSSLPYFDTEFSVPPALTNPYQQFTVHNDTRIDTPTLVTKRIDGSYWGIPFWQNYRSPKYGVIDGGVDGDDYTTEQGNFAWGYFYLTPDEVLDGQLGGSGYVQDNTLGYATVVGGASY